MFIEEYQEQTDIAYALKTLNVFLDSDMGSVKITDYDIIDTLAVLLPSRPKYITCLSLEKSLSQESLETAIMILYAKGTNGPFVYGKSFTAKFIKDKSKEWKLNDNT